MLTLQIVPHDLCMHSSAYRVSLLDMSPVKLSIFKMGLIIILIKLVFSHYHLISLCPTFPYSVMLLIDFTFLILFKYSSFTPCNLILAFVSFCLDYCKNIVFHLSPSYYSLIRSPFCCQRDYFLNQKFEV